MSNTVLVPYYIFFQYQKYLITYFICFKIPLYLQLYFNSTEKGWEVNVGTVPAGSMWRKIPIPRTVNEWNMYGASFEPVCEESDECKNSHHSTPKDGVCKCSGDWNDEVEIVDKVGRASVHTYMILLYTRSGAQ